MRIASSIVVWKPRLQIFREACVVAVRAAFAAKNVDVIELRCHVRLACRVVVRSGSRQTARLCPSLSLGLRRGSLRSPLRSERRLVGAVGFEPTTCCSQSSRAARLRYAPPMKMWPCLPSTKKHRIRLPHVAVRPAPARRVLCAPTESGVNRRRSGVLSQAMGPAVRPVTTDSGNGTGQTRSHPGCGTRFVSQTSEQAQAPPR